MLGFILFNFFPEPSWALNVAFLFMLGSIFLTAQPK
jgi:hypothetical protein